MPREPETVDRFKLSAHVELPDMGPLLAQLVRMGLTDIHYELVTDVIQFRNNRQRHPASAPVEPEPLMLPKPNKRGGHRKDKFAVSGEDVIWRHVKNRTIPFMVKELHTLFKGLGRTPASASPLLHKMTEAGVLKRISKGVYQVDKGRPKRNKSPAAAKAHNLNAKHYDVSNRDLVLGYAQDHPTFTAADIIALFKGKGRPKASASATVSVLCGKGTIKKSSEGMLSLVRAALNGAGTEQPHAN